MNQKAIQELKEKLSKECVREKEPMAQHTTFRVGGEAAVFIEIHAKQELITALEILQKYKEEYVLIGNGSNLLVSDTGYNGAILHFSIDYSIITVEDDKVICQAGALLSVAAKEAWRNGLTGLEFAAGIPGSVGGAIVMNAGAYDGEMKQIVQSVQLLDQKRNIVEKTVEEMKFSYRHSILKEEDWIVLQVVFQLKKGSPPMIRRRMEELAQKRREKQPLEYPSAGSTFKRPSDGLFAAKMIEEAGLRGYQIGGAQVSEKHCGFVINKDKATADEIYRLIQEIRHRVHQNTGVMLEPEVVLLGAF